MVDTAIQSIDEDDYGAQHVEKREKLRFDAWAEQFENSLAPPPSAPQAPTEAPDERGLGEEIAVGVTQIPRGMAHGAVEAVQETFRFGQSVYNWFWGDLMGVEDPTGLERFSRDRLSMTDEQAAEFSRGFQEQLAETIPQPEQPDTIIGNFTSKASQFIAGFIGAGKLMRAVQPATTTGKIAKATAQGAMADFAAFDPYEERLSNLLSDALSESPEVKGLVDQYLVSNQSDDEFTARLKNTAEGAALGLAVDGFVSGLRALRGWRQGKKTLSDLDMEPTVTERDFLALGDVTDDKIIRQRRPSATKKAMEAAGRVADEPVGDVYINWSRIDTPDDIKATLQNMAERGKTDIEAAARGTRTFKEIEIDAASQDAWEVLLNRRQGDPLNAEQSLAARNLWAASGRKMFEVAETAAQAPTEANLFQFRKMVSIHHAIQQEVLAARRETARALAQWRIPAGGLGQENQRAVESVLTQMGGSKMTREMAARIAALGRAGMIEEAEAVVSKSVGVKSWEAFQQVWINGLLSGPHTHAVNMLSNSTVVFQNMLERSVAARLSQLMGTTQGVAATEATAQWAGMAGSAKDAFKYAWKAFRLNQSGFGLGKIEAGREGALSSAALNLPADNILGRSADMLDTFTSLPGRALMAEDEFFKTIGYRMELNAQATRRAAQEVQQGLIGQNQIKDRVAELLRDPPEDIRLQAVNQADYQTFTNRPGRLAQSLSRTVNDVPYLRVILPFVRTPANIFNYAFERSPLAPVVSQWRADIAAGGARGDLAATRMAMGSMFMMAVADMAMDGTITGAGPADASQRQALSRAGIQPYSFKIGDRYYSYRRLDPIGMQMGLAADLVDILVNGDFTDDMAEDAEFATAAVAASIANNVFSKSYMTGISDFMTVMTDPNRYAENYIQRLIGTVVPTGAAQAARIVDPTARDARSIVDRVKSRVPLLSKDLPPSRDLWGRERKYESGIGKTYDALSPIYSRKENPEPIDREILDQGFAVRMPGRKQAFKAVGYAVSGITVDLDRFPGAYSRLLELRGTIRLPETGFGDRNVLDVLNTTVDPDSRAWFARLYQASMSDGPDGTKEDFVQDVLQTYMNAAKDRLLTEYPELAAEVQSKAAEKLRAKRGF